MAVGQPPFCEHVGIRCFASLQSLNVSGCEDIALLSLAKKAEMKYVLAIQLRNDIQRSLPFRGRVELVAQLQSGDKLRCSGPLVWGRIPSDFEASPNQFQLGFIKVGTDVKCVFSIRSSNSKPFMVISFGTDSNSSAQVKRVTSDGKLVQVVHRVRALGECVLNVTVDVEDDNGCKHRVDIPIRYVGVGAVD